MQQSLINIQSHRTYIIRSMTANTFEKLHPFSMTVSELADAGYEALPEQFISGEHLIYSSPAALSFNSPGAEGFGVKRAALSIPGSVLLLVSPGCCGRNTSGIGDIPQYRNRFFFLNMDEADIVTGKHLKKVPDAVENVVNDYVSRTGHKPSVVMICITCVDALLGTDMERVCRRAEEQVGLPVRPSYMYALTREGRRPPMVHVRQSLYSLLEKRRKRGTSINFIGNFAPLIDDCELYDIFRSIGVKNIRELPRCQSFDEFKLMAEANFNVVLNEEARPAAADMEKALGIPYIELRRLYQTDKIERQYKALGNALGVAFDTENVKSEALSAIKSFKEALEGAGFSFEQTENRPVFAVGEFLNADPFELSLSLVREGFAVSEIFGTVTNENFIYIEKLSELSPDTRIYSNLDPGMIHYDEHDTAHVDFVIGRDAAYYHPHAAGVMWREDIQPFGFAGVKKLYTELLSAFKASLQRKNAESASDKGSLHTEISNGNVNASFIKAGNVLPDAMFSDCKHAHDGIQDIYQTENTKSPCGCGSAGSTRYSIYHESSGLPQKHVRGYRSFLPPFAPDASGASSVLYSLGGIIVICDAGGCAGNICGFDEPRWLTEKSAIYSAGLRDMDAILGRDDRLVEKLRRASESVGGIPFAAIIGTPVPSVIATDYHALKRMSERRTGLKTLSIDTSGMELYDAGASKAYMELFSEFAESVPDDASSAGPFTGYTGILGAAPIDMCCCEIKDFFKSALGTDRICCFGMGDGLEAVAAVGSMQKNIVVSPSGLKAAEYLKRKFGIPYETAFPGALNILCGAVLASEEVSGGANISGSRDEYGDISKARACEDDRDCHDELIRNTFSGKNVLIIHQDVLSNAIADEIKRYTDARVTTACWFKTISERSIRLHDESDLSRLVAELKPDVIIGDITMRPLCESTGINTSFIDLPHFAVSGRLMDSQIFRNLYG